MNAAAITDGRIPKDSDIKTIANSWIEKDRLPVINAVRKYDSKTVTLTQVNVTRTTFI